MIMSATGQISNAKQGMLSSEGCTIAETYTYDAYGNPTIYDASGSEILNQTSQIGNRYLFQGREYDFVTHLYYFRARYYNPETGTWLSKDPIGISGGLNLYTFCGNNPVMFVDPSGERMSLDNRMRALGMAGEMADGMQLPMKIVGFGAGIAVAAPVGVAVVKSPATVAKGKEASLYVGTLQPFGDLVLRTSLVGGVGNAYIRYGPRSTPNIGQMIDRLAPFSQGLINDLTPIGPSISGVFDEWANGFPYAIWNAKDWCEK